MKKVFLPACIVALITLNSCGNPPKYDTTETNNTLPAVSDTTGTDVGTTLPQTLPSAPVQANPGAKAGALNPAHGLPNHRCDIAVGAPLNSPSQPLQQTAPANQPLPALPKPANGSARLNPAHGLPGHDCSIPVGQPLNS